MKKIIILVIVVAAVVGAIYYFESMKISPGIETVDATQDIAIDLAPKEEPIVENEEIIEEEEIIKEEKSSYTSDPKEIAEKQEKYKIAPELTGLTGYINTNEGIQIEDFRGKVVLIDFWTYSCINCVRTLPHLTAWDEKYRDQGLVTIGVHTPEFEFEKNKDNVEAAMEKHNIEYRVVQDNNYKTWRAFGNRFWPRKYLIDKDGFIRYDHIGEGKYEETERKIQELLEELGEDVDKEFSNIKDETPKTRRTPELYAGYKFALPRDQDIGNGGLSPDKEKLYILPNSFENDIIYLDGTWLSTEDNLAAKSKSSIVLNFVGNAVNIVVESGERMEVLVDDNYVTKDQAGKDVQFDGEISYVTINEPSLYNVYNGEYGRYILTLKTDEGFSFNAFTFG